MTIVRSMYPRAAFLALLGAWLGACAAPSSERTDALFVQAYGLERAGQPAAAAALYRRIATTAPSALVGTYAAERLALLAQTAPAAEPQFAAPEPGRRICSRPGLYRDDAGWCGRVVASRPEEIELEVLEVRLNSVFAFGLAASECTGGSYLSRFAGGRRIRVPAACLQIEATPAWPAAAPPPTAIWPTAPRP